MLRSFEPGVGEADRFDVQRSGSGVFSELDEGL